MLTLRRAACLGVLVLGGLALLAGQAEAQDANQNAVTPVKVGDRAPDFSAARDDETVVDLDSYLKQHKLVALVFVRAHW